MSKIFIITVLFLCCVSPIQAQYSTLNGHSHNDYAQTIPFFLAYNAHFGSIEADIWAVNGDLFVAHSKTEITTQRSLDSLYILPIVKLFRANGQKAWKDNSSTYQLLIDLKTEVEPTLSLLTQKLQKYPDVFNCDVNGIHIVITGNRPVPSDFDQYPLFISFDGNLSLKYDASQLQRIALFSENLKSFTSWSGKEAIPGKEELRLRQTIDSVHGINKKIRFWNAPDEPKAWKTFMNLKVDYINTDHIVELSTWLEGRRH